MPDAYRKFYQEVHEEQDGKFHVGKPHGWIQWKGTQVCMDLRCKCGYHGHVDTDFFYFYQCPNCLTKYAVGAHVKLIELTEEQSKQANRLQTSSGTVEG